MVGKEQMVMKGIQLELSEASWMFEFCWDTEDQLPINNLHKFHYVLKQLSSSILNKQEG